MKKKVKERTRQRRGEPKKIRDKEEKRQIRETFKKRREIDKEGERDKEKKRT